MEMKGFLTLYTAIWVGRVMALAGTGGSMITSSAPRLSGFLYAVHSGMLLPSMLESSDISNMVGLQTAPSAWEVEALHRGLASVDIGVGGTFRQAVVASGRHTERS